jgi:hypothetical protein
MSTIDQKLCAGRRQALVTDMNHFITEHKNRRGMFTKIEWKKLCFLTWFLLIEWKSEK